MTEQLEAAYKLCRTIARREAKNFYYAFLALPEAKRNAICAVYAFMRHADDLSDDESLPRPERLRTMEAWMQAWRVSSGATAGEAGETAEQSAEQQMVFLALADARIRFNIPFELLDQLVQGTAMDLDLSRDAAAPGAIDTYSTFDDLYRYCYYVASVVGLVCIRIFEYEDARAEKLAEKLGIGFQLTNILRDVREDAERGRVYLPLDDMAAHGVSLAELQQQSTAPSPPQRALLAFEAQRAEHFYASGTALLPMIAPDSRPALWVLMTIYHRLLLRIQQANYDVFTNRISVPTSEKVMILVRGMLGIARYRLFRM